MWLSTGSGTRRPVFSGRHAEVEEEAPPIADLRSGNTRERGFLHRRVAVPAIDSVVGNVVLVTEWNGLLPRDVDVGIISRLVHGKNQIPQPSQDEDRAIDRHLGDRVRAAMEDLRHRKILPDTSYEIPLRRLHPCAGVYFHGESLPRRGIIQMFSALLDLPGRPFPPRGRAVVHRPPFPKTAPRWVAKLWMPEGPGTVRWGLEEIRAGVASQGIL